MPSSDSLGARHVGGALGNSGSRSALGLGEIFSKVTHTKAERKEPLPEIVLTTTLTLTRLRRQKMD